MAFLAHDREALKIYGPNLDAALGVGARGVVRACVGRPRRDSALTFMGPSSLITASHAPRLIEGFVNLSFDRLVKFGALQIASTCDVMPRDLVRWEFAQ